MSSYYVALHKRCERAMSVEADDEFRAGEIALARIKAEGDYDDWTVDEAYVVHHRATGQSPADQAA